MESVRNYGIITGAYWAFTLTDGALRMLVLLHLHEQGIGGLLLAAIFFVYELMGVVTNGLGGWIGSRTGLKATLIAGLALQNVAYSDREELSTRVGFYSMANGALRGGHGLERRPL